MCFRRRFGVVCGCCRLGTTYGYRRLSTTLVCCRPNAIFVYVRVIQTSKIYPINNNKSNQ